MFYNIYIGHSPFKKSQYQLVLTRAEVEKVVEAFLSGEQTVRVKGKKLDIADPESFMIFDNSLEELGTNQSEADRFIQNRIMLLHRGKVDPGSLIMYGCDVTADFLQGGDWASCKNVTVPKQSHMVSKRTKGRIFISHSSKDASLVKKFCDHVLMLGMGLKHEDIFCTSIHGSDIRSGEDFKKVIRENLSTASAVIQLVTRNYKDSEICLNEMGAAWAICPIVIPLVANPFKYDVGFIHTNTQQLKLNSVEHLLKLYDDYKGNLFPENRNTSILLEQVKAFIDFVEKYVSQAVPERIFFYSDTATIHGYLKSGIFGGPPWEEDFEKCDSHHRYYFIELDPPIDVLSNELAKEEGNPDHSKFNIDRIQIAPEDMKSKVELKSWENKRVAVTGKFMGAHTAWHRTEVLLWFTDIKNA